MILKKIRENKLFLLTSLFSFIFGVFFEKIIERLVDEFAESYFKESNDNYYVHGLDNVLRFGDKVKISVKKNYNKDLVGEKCVINYNGEIKIHNENNSCSNIEITVPDLPWREGGIFINEDSVVKNLLYIEVKDKNDNKISTVEHNISFYPSFKNPDIIFSETLSFGKNIKYSVKINGSNVNDLIYCDISYGGANFFQKTKENGCEGVFYAEENYILNKRERQLYVTVSFFMEEVGRVSLFNKNFLVSEKN